MKLRPAVEVSGMTGAKILVMFDSAAVARLSSMLCHSICAPVSNVWNTEPVWNFQTGSNW